MTLSVAPSDISDALADQLILLGQCKKLYNCRVQGAPHLLPSLGLSTFSGSEAGKLAGCDVHRSSCFRNKLDLTALAGLT